MFSFTKDIGMDLGTASVLIYIKDKGIVLNEPSVVALDKNTGKLLKVGGDAQAMLGRTPGNIVAIRPLREGVISDYDMTERMLREFLHKVTGGFQLFKPRVIICVPSGITEVEERAVIDAGIQAGARRVYLIEEPVAAAIGAGIDITQPDGHFIIDIGGQDVKGISIDTDGTVKNFAMNDKCAAGTGRFFEAMARSFELSLPEFSKLSLTAKNVIPITAQCTVFAESEVITLVGEGKPMDEIAAGIEMAVAKRCFVMAKKAGATDSITLTGGCAKNDGLKQAIEHVLKLKVIDLKTDPQLMGALGAAEYARQKGMAKK